MKIDSKISRKFILGLIFVSIFFLAGVIGHDPWKQDETYSFGIIYHFFTTQTWLVPENGGVPFMEKPPLYYWTSVILCKILSPYLALHNAARLASVFYMLIASFFIWKSSQTLFRNDSESEKMGIISLAIFLGTLGVVRHAHDMFTDVALLAGSSMAFYGMALVTCDNKNWLKSGLWLGMGIGIAFLSKGLFTPALFALCFFILFLILPKLRVTSTLQSLCIAGLIAAPFLLIWPFLLYQYSPDVFMRWFWDNNIGRFLGFSVAQLGASNKPYYILYTVIWFAFPAFPLSVIGVWRRKSEWRQPEYLLPLTLSITGIILLQISASARALYILPLIPAFTILATKALSSIPDRFFQYWNGIICMVSAFGVAVVWLVWLGLQQYHPIPQILPLIKQFFPTNFAPENTQVPAIITALIAVLLQIYFQRRSVDLRLDAARIWFVGIAALWISGNTLLLPWINSTKSYRQVLSEMSEYVKHSPYGGSCINSYRLDESIAPMLEYFSLYHQLNAIKAFSAAYCPLVITFTSDPASNNRVPGWRLVWKGSRILDEKNEELRLYARDF